ncbi:hypothetical protein [Nocardia mangyaensis]|uniref:hypothetical protein n=1 Tax=Nocardia mangyaensis TaxID=2213200 RepID=UPI00267465DF|nr:hypothetical protein [Nocardia mangyaensis]MDO3648803.1 hypothetical protein [Nocardia mangyaensis]
MEPNAMKYLGMEFMNFRDYNFGAGGSHGFRWVDVRTFTIDDDLSDDRRILAGIIASVEYRDDYVGGGVDPSGTRHGPYWISSISADAFRSVDPTTATAVVEQWLQKCGTIPETLQHDLHDSAYQAIKASDSCYELNELGDSAINDYGNIHTEFHELVAIDRSAQKVALIVLSDD